MRQALRGDLRVQLDGECYQVPYAGEGASGIAVPLRPLEQVDHQIPIMIAAMGPKNVALTVAETDGLLPIMWSPTRWSELYGPDLFATASPDFELAPRLWVAVGDDLAACRDRVRPRIAFYVGAMGPPGRNYYAEVVRHYGYEGLVEEIARCYSERRGGDAPGLVPDELVDDLTLVGPPGHVASQLEAWRSSPVTTTLVVDAVDEPTLEALARLMT